MKKFSTRGFFTGKAFSLLLGLTLLSFTLYAGEIRVSSGKTEVRFTPGQYQSLSLTSTVSALQFRDVQTSAGTFTELYIKDYGYSNVAGDPKLPVFHRLIEAPLNAGFQIELSDLQYKDYDLSSLGITHPVIPAQAPVSKNTTDPASLPFAYNTASYQQNQLLGGDLVKVTPAGIMRSVNLARLDISPVEYNPVTGKIRIYESLTVKVVFKNADVAGTVSLKKQSYSIYFNSLYNQLPNFTDVPDSLITASPVTYVIIAPTAYQSALQPFIAWKKKKGFHVITGYTGNPNVGTTVTSIKAYLTALYNNPPTGYAKPSFILFVGDVAQIPASSTTGGHPSDLRYCEYTGDNIPEVFYGRYSASDVSMVQPYMDKVLEYEQYTMPSDAYLNEVTMVAGADASHQGTWGNGQINYGTTYYFNTAHGLTSHTYLQPEPAGGTYPQQIHTNVSNGVSYANYTAHGSEDGWADPEFVIADIAPLANDHKYCLMVGNCCKTNNFSLNCFGEEITRAAHKGALGYIGCTDYSYWDEDYWWGIGFKGAAISNPTYDPNHLGAYDVTFHDQNIPTSKWYITQGQMVVGGNMAVEESSSTMKQYYWEAYALMGDPSVSIYFSVPPALSATYLTTTMVGTSSLNITTEPYAYVSLTTNDTTLLSAKCADASGIVNLTFAPITSPDTLSLVITKQNRKPHLGHVNVIPATGPFMALSSYTLNDSIGGNNDHKADYCESLKMNVVINNLGVQTATAVNGTLSTADTNVTITGGTYHFGNIAAQGSATGLNAFSVKVGDKVIDQYKVNCSLVLTDGTNTWPSPLQINLNAPVLGFGSITVLDPAPGGNNNGILDPGETAQLKIGLTNTGHSSACNTIGHLSVNAASAPYILVSNPVNFLGTLAQTATDYLYFTVVTNGITPSGTTVTLNASLTAGMGNQYEVSKPIEFTIGDRPQVIMTNGSQTTCNGTFFDSGGPAGNYTDNEDFTMTFNPGTVGAKVKAVFTEFNIEANTGCSYDWFKIFNGATTSTELLGTWCGTNSPGTITSTTGPLTFQFHSDYSENFSGWAANISCSGGALALNANAFPPAICIGNTSQLVAIPSGGSGNYTYLWSPSTFLDDPTSRTPVSSATSNISYTVAIHDGPNSLTSSPVAITVRPLPSAPVITDNGGTLSSSISTGNQWFLNGAAIPNATQPTLVPGSSGTYQAWVTDAASGCPSELSNSVYFLMTGTDNHDAARSVTVYPNPFREEITVSYELPAGSNVTITISDAFGKEIKQVLTNSFQVSGKHEIRIPATGLTNGMYLIRVQTESFNVIKKAILNK